jgi:hypothetical protein
LKLFNNYSRKNRNMTAITKSNIPEYDSWEDAVDDTATNENDWSVVSKKKVSVKDLCAPKEELNEEPKEEPKEELKEEPKEELNEDENYPKLGSIIPPKDKGLKVCSTGKWSKMDVSIPSRIMEVRNSGTHKKFEKMGSICHLKTKLCNSVNLGFECPHGMNCRFAHSQRELVFPVCFFGNRCRFVKYHNGNWYNDCGKCNHIHPNETRENFMKRTGMEAMKEEEEEVKKIRSTMWISSTSSSAWYPRSTVKEEDVKDVVKEEDVKEEEVKEEENITVPKKLAWTKDAPKFVPPQVESNMKSKDVVLRVPANMATQAIELALKSGISVRVEVI